MNNRVGVKYSLIMKKLFKCLTFVAILTLVLVSSCKKDRNSQGIQVENKESIPSSLFREIDPTCQISFSDELIDSIATIVNWQLQLRTHGTNKSINSKESPLKTLKSTLERMPLTLPDSLCCQKLHSLLMRGWFGSK